DKRGTFYRDQVNDDAVASAAPPAANEVISVRRQTDSNKPSHLYDDFHPTVAAAKQEPAAPVTSKAFPEYKKAQKDISAFDTLRERETELITIAKNDNYYKKTAPGNKNKNNLSGFIKGQVTDQSNNPIANAYLQI